MVRRSAAVLAIAFTVALLAGTLMPLYGPPTSGEGLCLICGEVGAADFVDNILAFVPLGLAAALALGRPGIAALLVMLMSGTIEVLQWRIIAGRDASLGDLVANSLGGIIGAIIAAQWRAIAFPDRRVATRLIASWAILAGLVTGLTVWLTQPDPLSLKYRAYWMPNTHGLLNPSLDAVELFGTPVSHASWIEPDDLPSPFAAGELDISLSIQGSYTRNVPIDLFQLANRLERRINVVARDGEVVFQPLLKASRGRFWSPSSRLPGVLAGSDSTETRIRYTTRPGGAEASWASNGNSNTVDFRYSPIEFWRFLISDSVIPSSYHPILAFGCAAVLLLPLGYWSGFSRLVWGTVTAAVTTGVGALGWPLVAGRGVTHLSDLGLLSAALFVGWLVGRIAGAAVNHRDEREESE